MKAAGEIWLPLYSFPMSTVIVHFHTPEGFVTASDVRTTDDQGRIVSDETQKIFPVKAPMGILAFALAGTIKIGSSQQSVTFDFEEQTLAVSTTQSDLTRLSPAHAICPPGFPSSRYRPVARFGVHPSVLSRNCFHSKRDGYGYPYPIIWRNQFAIYLCQ